MKHVMKKLIITFLIITGIFIFWDTLNTPTFTFYNPLAEEVIPTEPEIADHQNEEVQDDYENETTVNQIEHEEHDVERFFYNQLTSDVDRQIYHIILNGLMNFEEEIIVEHDEVSRMHEIFVLITHDFPEIFWVTGSTNTTMRSWTDGRAEATFKPTYVFTPEEIISRVALIESEIEAFISTVEADATDYERVRLVYEHIIRTTSYDLTAPHHQTIYSVFANRASVCAGISRAAQLLLNRLGVFATYVTGQAYVPGTSSAPIGHAWNLVRVGGEYYFLDVTWGFPTFESDSAIGERIDVIYDYLLLTYDMIASTHMITEGLELPEVNSLTHTFFYKNNMFYTEVDESVLLDVLKRSVEQMDDWIAFQFSSAELFEEAREILLFELAPAAAQHLIEYHELFSTHYFIRERVSLNKITIYWVYEEAIESLR